jgi:hypothetical protein
MIIDLTTFGGEIPRLSENLLPVENAATAQDCDLDSGNLQQMKGLTTGIQSLAADVETIHRLTSSFLSFTSSVNIVRSFVSSSSRLVYTGDGYPKEYDGTNHIRLGIAAPENALTIHLTGTQGEEDTAREISYVYTLVSKRSDGSEVESAPSAPTGVTTIYSSQTVAVSGFTITGVPTGTIVSHYRLYRMNAGNYNAEYQFVKEITTAQGTGEVSDTTPDSDLDEIIQTTNWTSPDASLSGLVATSHGMLFGFVDNRIYPSETFIPYAFPEIYSMTTESDIVGLGYTGSMVVVLTETVPYLIYGQNPETLELRRLGHAQPCVSAKSIVNVPGGVVYAAPDGLFMINESGQGSLITSKILTRQQWSAKTPEKAIGFHYDESYLCFFEGTTDGFQLHLGDGRYSVYSMPQAIHGGVYSPEDDKLYLIRSDGAVKDVASWKTGTKVNYSWKSKIFLFPRLIAVTAAMVQGVFGSVTLTLYVDGVAQTPIVVTSDDIYRIAPVLGSSFQILLSGSATVDRVRIGDAVGEVVNG